SGQAPVAAVRVACALIRWHTGSPPGWFDEAEFAATARSFTIPDWVAVALHAYRSRFLADEPGDPRSEQLTRRLAETETLATPTLMIQGDDDRCDPPSAS